MKSEPQEQIQDWKQRLYQSYVTTGQAGSIATRPEDTFRPREAYVKHLIEHYLPPVRTVKVLDIGCGHGAMLYFLSQAGYTSAYGIDISFEQIAKARDLGITNVDCCLASDYLQRSSDGELDVVLLFDILEHLESQELFNMLDDLYRVLRPGGTCLIHVPNGQGIFGSGTLHGDLTHFRAFTKKSAEQMLAATGFSNIECFEERPIPHGVKSFFRRLIWDIGTLPIRLLFAAESGSKNAILSANLLVKCTKL